MTPADTLQHIQTRLASETPINVIDALSPQSHAQAVTWSRRLPLWDEYRGDYTGQVVALARAVSRRAMREFGLVFDAEGRVVQKEEGRRTEPQTKTWAMQIGEETIEVRYTPHYFQGTDLFSFVGEEVPPKDDQPISQVLDRHKPHALSESGWWSHYAPHDVVEACGGPKAFAQLYADARLAGQEEELAAALEGKTPEKSSRGKPKPARPERPVLGGYTAEVAQERREEAEPMGPVRQRELFA